MIKSVEQTILLLRPIIAMNAELNLNDVINADSIRGPELTKIVNGQKVAYQPHENVIIFELTEDRSLDYVETFEEDNKVHTIDSYSLHLTIYGDDARTLAKKLKARLLSQKIRSDLSEQGISISTISPIEPSTEMINTTRYIRRDMTINFITELKFDLIDDYEEIETVRVDNIKSFEE